MNKNNNILKKEKKEKEKEKKKTKFYRIFLTAIIIQNPVKNNSKTLFLYCI